VMNFARSRMTDGEFQAFQGQIDSQLRGVEASTLTTSEMGDVVGRALAGARSEGLYWSGCAQFWTGAAIAAAAVVAGIFAIIKSKSIESIQRDYQKKLAEHQANDEANIRGTQSSYDNSIANTRNWRNAYPSQIGSDQNQIYTDQNQISINQNQIWNNNSQINTYVGDRDYYQGQLDNLTWQYNNDQISAADYNTYSTKYKNYISDDETYISRLNSDNWDLQRDIQNLNSDISWRYQDISSLQAAIARYTADPSLAEADALALTAKRDRAIADLQAAMAADLAKVQLDGQNAVGEAPSNQALGKKLGIGAGIGAAIAAALIVHGIHDGVHCGS
jgi:hypothetical protein